MSLLYANFTDSTVNYGNHIIELATRKVLKPYLQNKEIKEFDSFGEKIPSGQYNSMLIPGCTMITPGQNKSLDNIKELNYNTYCFAGSLWYPTKEKSFLIKTRVIKIGKDSIKPDLSIVKELKGIIGCRDIFTYQVLKNAGLDALYTGCPTLFLDKTGVEDQDYVLFSFGRKNFHKQVYYASKIAKKHKVIGIVHETNDAKRVKAAGWKLPLIDYLDDIELYLSYFKKAKYVVSGRLHGVLPALAYDKKSFYFGTNDSRTTILDHLGLKVHKYSEIPQFETKSNKIQNMEVLDYFKSNMTKVAQSIFSSENDKEQ